MVCFFFHSPIRKLLARCCFEYLKYGECDYASKILILYQHVAYAYCIELHRHRGCKFVETRFININRNTGFYDKILNNYCVKLNTFGTGRAFQSLQTEMLNRNILRK